MKIIIVGGGIGGLSVYHALHKQLSEATPSVTIKVYESHDSPTSSTSNIGGGLGLSPNGLRALSAASTQAVEHIQTHGFRSSIMTFRNSSGTLLGRYWNGREERYGFGHVLLPRAVVHDALVLGVPDDAVEWGKKVRSVHEVEGGVELEFEDGSTERADLVIGADGVRSVVREGIFGKKYEAEYEGYTGVGGFLPLTSLSKELRDGLQQDPVTITFGSQGVVGYSLADGEQPTKQLMWWSTYEVAQPPQRDAPASDILAQLLDRHASWQSPYDSPDAPLFKTITTLGCTVGSSSCRPTTSTTSQNDILILPRYLIPRLPNWCSPSGKIILLGDAAHAMPPDAGQGVSSAAEDAVALALLLKHYHSTERFELGEALKRTAKSYEEVRMKRVWMILDRGKRRGNNKKMKSWWQEWIRDWMLWLLCKLPESLNDRLYGYDVEVEVAKHILTSGVDSA